MHDGGVVVAQLAGVSEPPAVAAAVVRAVGVPAVVALGQSRSGPDPLILVELGSAGILSKVFNIEVFFRCDSISTFDHVTQSVSHSVTITLSKYSKEDLYMVTLRNY